MLHIASGNDRPASIQQRSCRFCYGKGIRIVIRFHMLFSWIFIGCNSAQTCLLLGMYSHAPPRPMLHSKSPPLLRFLHLYPPASPSLSPSPLLLPQPDICPDVSTTSYLRQVLIFSQMTRMLDLLHSYLEATGFEPCRIDGSVKWQDRQVGLLSLGRY